MSNQKHTKGFVDHNATVPVGITIDGVFTHKLPTGMVVSFKHDGKPCSGVLHVSQFPSNERSMRDKMFGVAVVGMPAPGLKVIGVEPPAEGKHFTRVRLSARPAKETPTAGQRGNAPKRTRNTATTSGAPASLAMAVGVTCSVPGLMEPVQRREKRLDGGGTDKIPVRSADGKIASLPLPAVPSTASFGHEVESIFSLPPADPVASAKRLVVEARKPARSCGLADLGRTMAIARLGGDSYASELLGSIESHLGQIDALAIEETQIRSSLNEDTLARASQLYGIRVQKRELDAETAALKQESARYAGLCGKVKRAGANVPSELQSQADEMKSAIDAKRASLKEALAANKMLDDNVDVDLLFSLHGPDIDAEREEALEIAGKLAGTIAQREKLVGELVGIIDTYERRLAVL